MGEDEAHPVVIDEDIVRGGQGASGHFQQEGPGDEAAVCVEKVDL